jgi:hypothetical protein
MINMSTDQNGNEFLGKLVRINDSKISPLGYSIGLVASRHNLLSFYSIVTGFMFDCSANLYEYLPFPFSYPSKQEHIDFMEQLKRHYSSRTSKGAEKVIDLLRLKELTHYIANYDEKFEITKKLHEKNFLSNYINYEKFESFLSSKRYIHDENIPGFFIYFPERHIKGGNSSNITIIKSNLEYDETNSFVKERSGEYHNFVFRRLKEEMIPLIKGMPYVEINIEEKVLE